MLDLADKETLMKRSAAVAKALADPKRLCVLQSLASGELSVHDREHSAQEKQITGVRRLDVSPQRRRGSR